MLNVDGLERNRRKWNAAGKLAYRVSETLSTILPDAVVTDARVIQEYYRSRYGCDSTFIPYGGDLPAPEGRSTLERLGLEPEKYVLYVSRLEPENNAEEVVREYRDVPGETPLVVVGDAPYAADYIARLRAGADTRVRFPGAIYGAGYRELLAHAARLRAGDGGRRNASGARRGAGIRARRLLQLDSGERGGRRRRRPALRRACAGEPGAPAGPQSWMIRPATPYGKNERARACGSDIVGRMSFAGTRRFLKGGPTSHNIPEAPRFGPRLGYVRC